MTPERAREVHEAQKKFPYWGNYQRFMTEEEIADVRQLFMDHPDGNITIAAIIYRIGFSEEAA